MLSEDIQPSHERLRHIGDLALSLDERLSLSPLPSEGLAQSGRYLEHWLRIVAAGDLAAFRRRLDWDGWEISRVRAAFTHQIGGTQQHHAWLDLLEQALDLSVEMATEFEVQGGIPEEDLGRSGRPIPFLELWAPFLRLAGKVLNGIRCEHLPLFSVPAWRDLQRRLALDLATWGGYAALASFERSRSRWTDEEERGAGSPERHFYRRFIISSLAGSLEFLSERGALARRLAESTRLWIEATGELVERFAADRPVLERELWQGRELGPVTGIETDLSEAHGGGRRVMVLTFGDGRRLVYKPRPVDLEAAFQALLVWLASRGLQSSPPVFKVLPRPGYGWCEWVEPGAVSTPEEANLYFESAGSLLCLVELLGGDDLHAENVIATSRGPVLIDCETLLQPGQHSDLDQPPLLRSQLATSVQLDAAGRWFDLGGLQGHEVRLGDASRRSWLATNTDAMRIESAAALVQPGRNVLYCQGRPCLLSAHTSALVRGFTVTYRFLLARRGELLSPEGPLRSFRSVKSRVLLRSSQNYATLLVLSREARFQRSGIAMDLLAEAGNRAFTADRRRPTGWDVTAAERRALALGDIPRFEVRTDSTEIDLGSGQTADGCFAVSGWSLFATRVARMSELELTEWVRELQRLGRRRRQPRVPPPDIAPSPQDLSAHAVSIGERLFHKDSGLLIGKRGERGLYAGRLGVALFAAALARETGRSSLATAAVTAARKALERPRSPRDTHDLGLFSGLGGDLYAAALIGRWLDDPALAETISLRLPPSGNADLRTAPSDLAGGLSGLVLGALAFAATTGDSKAGELAVQAGTHLAELVETAPILPPGVAHGYAGIALAFSRLALCDGDPWRAPARQAWEQEALMRVEPPEFGPGLTRHGHGWCRGTAGLGLVALELLRSEVIAGTPVELSVALAVAGPSADLDGLCCGVPGELDLLFEATRTLAISGLHERFLSAALTWDRKLRLADVVLDRDSRGRRFFRKGLFRGLAGIGYELLRLSRPEVWPSLLLFAAPVTSERWAGGDVC